MPNWGNKNLKKYEDKYYVSGIGTISFSAFYHDLSAVAQACGRSLGEIVRASAAAYRDRARAKAPKKTRSLAEGIIVNPEIENSSTPHKVVRDILFDARMNDTFVKMTKTGKRYYYPASQEYGFKKVNGGRVPGRYYMRDAAVEYAAEHRDRVADGIDNILEEL